MKIRFLLIGLIGIMTGCTSYRIVSREDVSGDTLGKSILNPISKSWESLNITVHSLERREIPSEIRRQVIGFDITVLNQGDEELQIVPDQFILIDSNQVQHYPLTPDELYRSSSGIYYPRNQFVFGFGIADTHYRSHYGYNYRYGMFETPLYAETRPTLFQSFRGGEIVPQAQVQGRFYYDRIPLVEGHKIDLLFRVDGKPRLVFPYIVRKN